MNVPIYGQLRLIFKKDPTASFDEMASRPGIHSPAGDDRVATKHKTVVTWPVHANLG